MSPRRMHCNSLEAFWSGRKELFTKRENEVLAALCQYGALTDREVMLKLGYVDKNAVSPRITELVEDGVLQELGSTICPVTGKRVRIVSFKKDPRAPQAEFGFTEVVKTDCLI